ncbi:MAG: TIGR02757 family protein [Bacteroidales bacterium]|nr:TIGR02757 family protein [Bacteroidales bacterium]
MKSFLDQKVLRYNTAEFILTDPVQFPRRYTRKQDIEIVSFLVSHISWGKRTMILRDAERMLAKFGQSPYEYVMNDGYKNLGSDNIHRTFFEHDLKYFLGGFKNILSKHDTVEDFLKAENAKSAWDVASLLLSEMLSANNGLTNKYCLPTSPENSAIKRINMALRWLVRDDGIVDIGIWKIFTPAELFIPLDVHVANVSRDLGLLTRKSNDRKAVEELTCKLRQFCPHDPVKYDFALFGTGIGNDK